MTQYLHTSELTDITCWSCAILYAVPTRFYNKRQEDGGTFYCPNGHSTVFKETEATRLRRQLEKSEQRLSQEQDRRAQAEESSRRKERKYARIRDRVKNGVCPCCNRTFTNLGNHMKSQHPDFGKDRQLKTLRLLYGLTQADLASEIGVSAATISLAERGKPGLSNSTENLIEAWLESA